MYNGTAVTISRPRRNGLEYQSAKLGDKFISVTLDRILRDAGIENLSDAELRQKLTKLEVVA